MAHSSDRSDDFTNIPKELPECFLAITVDEGQEVVKDRLDDGQNVNSPALEVEASDLATTQRDGSEQEEVWSDEDADIDELEKDYLKRASVDYWSAQTTNPDFEILLKTQLTSLLKYRLLRHAPFALMVEVFRPIIEGLLPGLEGAAEPLLPDEPLTDFPTAVEQFLPVNTDSRRLLKWLMCFDVYSAESEKYFDNKLRHKFRLPSVLVFQDPLMRDLVSVSLQKQIEAERTKVALLEDVKNKKLTIVVDKWDASSQVASSSSRPKYEKPGRPFGSGHHQKAALEAALSGKSPPPKEIRHRDGTMTIKPRSPWEKAVSVSSASSQAPRASSLRPLRSSSKPASTAKVDDGDAEGAEGSQMQSSAVSSRHLRSSSLVAASKPASKSEPLESNEDGSQPLHHSRSPSGGVAAEALVPFSEVVEPKIENEAFPSSDEAPSSEPIAFVAANFVTTPQQVSESAMVLQSPTPQVSSRTTRLSLNVAVSKPAPASRKKTAESEKQPLNTQSSRSLRSNRSAVPQKPVSDDETPMSQDEETEEGPTEMQPPNVDLASERSPPASASVKVACKRPRSTTIEDVPKAQETAAASTSAKAKGKTSGKKPKTKRPRKKFGSKKRKAAKVSPTKAAANDVDDFARLVFVETAPEDALYFYKQGNKDLYEHLHDSGITKANSTDCYPFIAKPSQKPPQEPPSVVDAPAVLSLLGAANLNEIPIFALKRNGPFSPFPSTALINRKCMSPAAGELSYGHIRLELELDKRRHELQSIEKYSSYEPYGAPEREWPKYLRPGETMGVCIEGTATPKFLPPGCVVPDSLSPLEKLAGMHANKCEQSGSGHFVLSRPELIGISRFRHITGRSEQFRLEGSLWNLPKGERVGRGWLIENADVQVIPANTGIAHLRQKFYNDENNIAMPADVTENAPNNVLLQFVLDNFRFCGNAPFIIMPAGSMIERDQRRFIFDIKNSLSAGKYLPHMCPPRLTHLSIVTLGPHYCTGWISTQPGFHGNFFCHEGVFAVFILPRKYRALFHKLAADHAAETLPKFRNCPQLLYHNRLKIDPEFVASSGIPLSYAIVRGGGVLSVGIDSLFLVYSLSDGAFEIWQHLSADGLVYYAAPMPKCICSARDESLEINDLITRARASYFHPDESGAIAKPEFLCGLHSTAICSQADFEAHINDYHQPQTMRNRLGHTF